jgi:hypothetical protein
MIFKATNTFEFEPTMMKCVIKMNITNFYFYFLIINIIVLSNFEKE